MKKQMWHEEDDSSQKLMDQETKDFLETIVPNYKDPVPYNNGIQAKSPLAANGRRCPKCSGLLLYMEETEGGTILVRCNSCKTTWQHHTLENHDHADAVYRDIPDAMMQRWMQAREDERLRG